MQTLCNIMHITLILIENKLQNEKVIESVEEVLSYDPYATFVPGNMIPSFFPGFKVCVFHGFVGYKTRCDL